MTKLSSVPEFTDLRLVGGTSLALQIGHRNSTDIDLFGTINLTHEDLIDILNQTGMNVRSLQSSRSIHIFSVNDIKTDFVNYPYPWLERAVEEEGFKLARKEDVAAMKIAAITQRGSRKDFIDLYFLLQKFTFTELLGFYVKKITDGNIWLALKSMTYFRDAEKQIMPKMFVNVSWDKVKTTIIEEVNKYE